MTPTERRLSAMTRLAIEALPDRGSAIVILPTGSIEQHGPHLPVGVDAILGQGWLAATLPLLPPEAPVYVAPPVTFGMSDEHRDFPGTLSIGPAAFHRLILVAARQVRSWGFGALAVLNTHGGNSAALVATLREVQTRLGLPAAMLAPAWKPPVSEREAALGIHAGRIETAWMLAFAPHLVAMDKAVREYPPRSDGTTPLARSWLASDVSKSGVIGDATDARADEGRAWVEVGARSLADQILRFAEAVRRTGPSP